jgi:type I restriction enzyme M protein
MFEQTFKNIDDILHKDAGCTSELDYTEQSSWLLFLKYLDALEADKALEAELDGKTYSFIIDKPYRWESWAAPKGADGKLDHNTAMTGDDLRDFVNNKLFPYLHGFKQRASGPQHHRIQNWRSLWRDQKPHPERLQPARCDRAGGRVALSLTTEKHELSHLYEAKIKNMGNAGRNGGEYYTPRPLIRAMIKVDWPPRLASAFMTVPADRRASCAKRSTTCNAQPKPETSDQKTLQTRTFYGKEKRAWPT